MRDDQSLEFLTLQRALLGRFSLLRELGRGGMGIVYLARDVSLDRNVAIKLLPPSLAVQPQYRQRFLREARLAAGLSHPHIVPIHVVDEVENLVFFVMGFVDGETLGERIRRRGPLPVAEVVAVVQQVAWALAHAHSRGVVHRDVKPDNILIEHESGRAVVSDFGIAGGHGAITPADGVAVGTPLYLSPEQATGAPGDARSDLYALGVTAWYALTGTHPHQGANVAALLVEKSTQPARAVRELRPDTPPAVAAAIDRCLATTPGDRWPDGEALARQLDEARARIPVAPPRVRAFVRATMPLGTEVTAAGAAALSSLGMMTVLSQGGLIAVIIAQAIAVPVVALAVAYGAIRVGQSGIALLDVVRAGHDHATVQRALLDEERELALEVEGRESSQRRRDALWYGSLGAVKTAGALWIASSNVPFWIQLPAALGAVLIPTLSLLKVWHILRPGPGRWPQLMRGRLGRGVMNFMRRFTGGGKSAVVEHAPTVTLLGGAIEELFLALPAEARRQLADLPTLAKELQREAARIGDAQVDDAARERAASVAIALESLRIELLSLRAGLREVSDITRHLDEARRLGERIDAWEGAPEVTPTS